MIFCWFGMPVGRFHPTHPFNIGLHRVNKIRSTHRRNTRCLPLLKHPHPPEITAERCMWHAGTGTAHCRRRCNYCRYDAGNRSGGEVVVSTLHAGHCPKAPTPRLLRLPPPPAPRRPGPLRYPLLRPVDPSYRRLEDHYCCC